jgi:hypothetical protein
MIPTILLALAIWLLISLAIGIALGLRLRDLSDEALSE